LRQHLRDATAAKHDRLDAEMGPLAMGGTAQFIRFLQIQHSARVCVEEWLYDDACALSGALPNQAPLIESDLAALGAKPLPKAFINVPQRAHILGAMWAMAGSSLGNQMILAHRRKAGLLTPSLFLADPAMSSFFKRLRPSLDVPCPPANAESVIEAADAVFDAFGDACARYCSSEPAAAAKSPLQVQSDNGPLHLRIDQALPSYRLRHEETRADQSGYGFEKSATHVQHKKTGELCGNRP
jgi:heme oxygenase